MALVKVSITNRQKKVKLPSGLRLLVRRACNAVLTAEKFAGPAEVSVTFVDNEQIQELNAEYRGKDISTDVLSFPLGENGKFDKNRETGAYVLGDVVISAEKAVLQAEIYGHSLQREIAFLTVHSMLHILVYDHVAGGMEQVRMREKEEAIMLQLGLPRDASYVSEE